MEDGHVNEGEIRVADASIDPSYPGGCQSMSDPEPISESPTGEAPYAVSLAYRMRFAMQMNAREAMHVLELRSSPQGHPTYRRVCQDMYRLIAEQAGHRAIAAAMTHIDHDAYELEAWIRRVDERPRV